MLQQKGLLQNKNGHRLIPLHKTEKARKGHCTGCGCMVGRSSRSTHACWAHKLKAGGFLGQGRAHSCCTHIFHLLQGGMGRALKMGDVSRCQSLGWGVQVFLKCPLHFGGCFRNISLTSPPFPPCPSSRYWKVHQHP